MISNNEQSTEKVVSPVLQLVFVVIGGLIMVGAITYRIKRFRAFEKQISLETFTPQILKDFGATPNDVRVGMSIDTFKLFDVPRNSFYFSAIIWFSFVPGRIPLSDLEKFDFMFSTIEYRSSPIMTIVGDRLLVAYHIKASLAAQLNYQDFPLNDHRIYLTLINTSFLPVEALFSSTYDDLVINADVTNFGWSLVDKRVRTGYVKLELNDVEEKKIIDFPAVTFVLDYSQFSTRNLMALFIPLLIICYIGLFSFSLRRQIGFPLISGAVTATLGYRFVIESLSPRVGYFMLVDKIFLLTLLITSMALIVMIAETYGAESWNSSLSTINKIFVSCFHILLIVSVVYLIG